MRGICLPILFLGLPSETLDSLRVMFEKLCLVTRGLRPNVPIALCKSSLLFALDERQYVLGRVPLASAGQVCPWLSVTVTLRAWPSRRATHR